MLCCCLFNFQNSNWHPRIKCVSSWFKLLAYSFWPGKDICKICEEPYVYGLGWDIGSVSLTFCNVKEESIPKEKLGAKNWNGGCPTKTTCANFKYLFNAYNVPGTMLMLGVSLLPTCIVSSTHEREAQEG